MNRYLYTAYKWLSVSAARMPAMRGFESPLRIIKLGVSVVVALLLPFNELIALTATRISAATIPASATTPYQSPLLRRLRQQPRNAIKFAIPPQFDYASLFFRGRAQVELNEQVGLIDQSGNFIIKPQFERFSNLLYFTEGLGLVEKDGIYGYINKSGEMVISRGFAVASGFSEGLAAVAIYDNGEYKYGYINESGSFVIPPKFEQAFYFSEGVAAVRIGKKVGFINKTGKTVIPPQFDGAMEFHEGLAGILNLDTGNAGYIDKTGKILFHVNFLPSAFSEGLAQAKIGKKYGFIDKTGKMLIPAQFDWVDNFSQGRALVKISNKYGYIDKNGKVIIPLKFDYLGQYFSIEGLTPASIGGKYGFINKSGSFILKPQFEDAENFSAGLAAVKINGKWGYIDTKGDIAIAPQFEEADQFSEGLAAVKSSGKWGYIRHLSN